MSYRDLKYPENLDFSALNDIIKGDNAAKAKAEYHVQGFLFGRILGEPNPPAPMVSGQSENDDTTVFSPALIHPAEIESAKPFSTEEISVMKPVSAGPIADVILVIRLIATIRKYAPAFYDFLKQYIVSR